MPRYLANMPRPFGRTCSYIPKCEAWGHQVAMHKSRPHMRFPDWVKDGSVMGKKSKMMWSRSSQGIPEGHTCVEGTLMLQSSEGMP